jgi:uncharacterized protein (TIGR01777 family)
MKIVVAGGTGFLGRHLCARLASWDHEVVVLTRGASGGTEPARRVTWNPVDAGGHWVFEIDGADAVVNLAGEGLADRRWTVRRKDVLRQSRIASTRGLVAAIRSATRRPSVFVSGSAIGYYGDADARPLDESFPPGSDFLATLCVDWEAEAHGAAALGCRVVIIRTGVVLARDGGALKKLIPPFLFFLGGPIASGRQYLSWIHRDDWVRLVDWTISRPDVSGAVNATAPNPVTNAEFSAAVGRALQRPSWFRVPRLALRVLVGEMADDVLVGGQRVVPTRALNGGFTFDHQDVDGALRAIVNAG